MKRCAKETSLPFHFVYLSTWNESLLSKLARFAGFRL